MSEQSTLNQSIENASKLMQQSAWHDAALQWRAIIDHGHPNMPKGVFARLADAYRKLGQPESVLKVVAEAERTGIWDLTIYRLATQALLEAKRGEEALLLARKTAANAPTPSDKIGSLEMIANLEAKVGNPAKAVEILQGLIQTLDAHPKSANDAALRAEVERISEQFASKDAWERYWRQRQDFVYLHVIRRLIELISPSARVVADIGSNRTPILDFFQGPQVRYSVDIENPYRSPNVISVLQDFYVWNPPEKVDVVTCFQVIEHVPHPDRFVRRLLEFGEVVLFSVPHKEPAGLNPGHINNDIDLEVIERWAGRRPNFHYVARELSGDERIICLFDTLSTKPTPQLHREHPDAMTFRYRWGAQNPIKVLPD